MKAFTPTGDLEKLVASSFLTVEHIGADSVALIDSVGKRFVLREGDQVILEPKELPRATIERIIRETIRGELGRAVAPEVRATVDADGTLVLTTPLTVLVDEVKQQTQGWTGRVRFSEESTIL